MASPWALGFEFGFGIIASLLGIATGPVEAAILECEAAVAAEVAAATACDPDPCRVIDDYWLLATPKIPPRRHLLKTTSLQRLFEGRITAESLQFFRRAADTSRKIPAFELAAFETCSRAQSAKLKRDARSQRSQIAYKEYLIKEVLSLRRQAADQWEAFAVHARQNNIVGRAVGAGDYRAFLDALRGQGFPAIEIDMIKAFGLTDEEIDRVRHRILKEFKIADAPRTVDEGLFAMILAYRHGPFTCECKAR